MILQTSNLTRRYGALIAVDHLNLALEEGEVFGLLGPNGAGKTTTLKMLTTLLPPSDGSATVAGFDIRRQAAQVRRVIGYVPQLISADGALSGYENLLIAAKLYDIPRAEREQRIIAALDFMGLRDVAHRLVREYSGGMIRRLEIAQAILHRPRVLFLDEPTVGLDPVARHLVWDYIRQIRQNLGTTILLTTHLMDEADLLCDRVGIMHLGRLVACDTPQALKVAIGKPEATLDEVFIHFTGNQLQTTMGGYRETARTRRVARRLG